MKHFVWMSVLGAAVILMLSGCATDTEGFSYTETPKESTVTITVLRAWAEDSDYFVSSNEAPPKVYEVGHLNLDKQRALYGQIVPGHTYQFKIAESKDLSFPVIIKVLGEVNMPAPVKLNY